MYHAPSQSHFSVDVWSRYRPHRAYNKILKLRAMFDIYRCLNLIYNFAIRSIQFFACSAPYMQMCASECVREQASTLSSMPNVINVLSNNFFCFVFVEFLLLFVIISNVYWRPTTCRNIYTVLLDVLHGFFSLWCFGWKQIMSCCSSNFRRLMVICRLISKIRWIGQ